MPTETQAAVQAPPQAAAPIPAEVPAEREPAELVPQAEARTVAPSADPPPQPQPGSSTEPQPAPITISPVAITRDATKGAASPPAEASQHYVPRVGSAGGSAARAAGGPAGSGDISRLKCRVTGEPFSLQEDQQPVELPCCGALVSVAGAKKVRRACRRPSGAARSLPRGREAAVHACLQTMCRILCCGLAADGARPVAAS